MSKPNDADAVPGTGARLSPVDLLVELALSYKGMKRVTGNNRGAAEYLENLGLVVQRMSDGRPMVRILDHNSYRVKSHQALLEAR